jgi:hypothetical protein
VPRAPGAGCRLLLRLLLLLLLVVVVMVEEAVARAGRPSARVSSR